MPARPRQRCCYSWSAASRCCSLPAVTQVDPGFETRRVAVASVAPALVGRDWDEAYRYLSRVAAAVQELPDVEAVG